MMNLEISVFASYYLAVWENYTWSNNPEYLA